MMRNIGRHNRLIILIIFILRTLPFINVEASSKNVNSTLEKPLSTNEITSFSKRNTKRTNFCPLYHKVIRKEISRLGALNGLNISISIAEEINEKNPYFAIRILDKIAHRANFHYTAYVTGYPKRNQTWTDLLTQITDDYDLAVDWWAKTSERLSLGVLFPEVWYNSDTILVMKQEPEEDAFVLFGFTKPFSPYLWLVMLLTMIFTGMTYAALEYLHLKAQNENCTPSMELSIFSSIYSYTGSRSVFAPKSRASMLLVISMAFLYLILVSAYTANLTKYYVSKTRPPNHIQSIEDVIQNGLVICVTRSFANTDRLKQEYSNALLLELEEEQECLAAVSDRKCDVALMTIEGYETYKRDEEYNKDCDLAWVGRRVFIQRAGYALKDSLEHCSMLLDSVLEYHLLQMVKEGEIEEIMELYRTSKRAATCDVRVKQEKSENSQLSVLNLGGAFAVHFLLVLVSFIFMFFDYFSNRHSSFSSKNSYFHNQQKKEKEISYVDESNKTTSTCIASDSPYELTLRNTSMQILEKTMKENIDLMAILKEQMQVDNNLKIQTEELRQTLQSLQGNV